VTIVACYYRGMLNSESESWSGNAESDPDLKALVELGLIEPASVDGQPGYRLNEALANTSSEALIARLVTRQREQSGG